MTTTPEGRIDSHGSALPSNHVLRRIEADILTGRLAANERLASERELAARLGVARNTLRRALGTLAGRGLIEARGRNGWVVLPRPMTEQETPQGLTAWGARRGLVVTSRLVASRSTSADPAAAARLRIATGARAYELERVRLVDGDSLSLDLSILHPRVADVVAGVDFSTHSLYQVLRERGGVIPTRADVVLRSLTATPRVADLLGIAHGAPLLELEETVFDQYGEPFEASRLLNRGDRYAFATTLTLGSPVPLVEVDLLSDGGRARRVRT
jgi:GntR family transcriptional regulator